MTSTWIHNVRFFQEDELIQGSLLVEGKHIKQLLTSEGHVPQADHMIDGGGRLLIPGMIDVHIHGAEGEDMMDGRRHSVETVSKVCARTGCTAFLATSVSSTLEDLLQMISSVSETMGHEPGARIVGMHIEGPYLNVKKKGMQNERYLRHPDKQEMDRILDHGGALIRMVTLASELPGGMEMVRYLHDKGIVVALAHSDASYEEAQTAFRSGASHVTHCFNGMRPMHHRDPGLVLAAFEENHVSVQAIVDDVHLHPAIVRLMYREKGADRMVLITDALQAMGLGDGTYSFGGHEVKVEDGVARMADGTLASSTVTMNQALHKTVALGVPLPHAIKMASQTPADVLGLSHKGRIAPGADADLVLLDEDYEVLWTIIEGDMVYRRS